MFDLRTRAVSMATLALLISLAGCGGGGGASGSIVSAPPPPPPPPPPSSGPSEPANSSLTPSGPYVPITTLLAPAQATVVGSLPQASVGGPTMKEAGAIAFPLIQSVQFTDNGTIRPDLATMNAGMTLAIDDVARRGTFNSTNPALAAASVPLARTPSSVYFETSGRTTIRLSIGWLDWTAMGSWTVYPNSSSNDQHFSHFVTGFQTPGSAIPSAGTATYAGEAWGETQGLVISGSANLEANFATGSLTGTLTGMQAGTWDDGYLPWNSISLSALFGVGQSSFSGTTAVTFAPSNERALAAGATGTIAGSFFGPSAQEVGAVWTLYDGARSAIGTLVAKR